MADRDSKRAADNVKKIVDTAIEAVQDKAVPLVEAAKDMKSKAEPAIGDVLSKAGPAARDMRMKAEPIARDILDKTRPVIDETMKKADPYLQKAKTVAAPAVSAVKKSSKKAAEKAKIVGDDLAAMAAKNGEKDEVFIQYGDLEVRTADMLDKCREHYIAEGHKPSDIHQMQLYIKPEDKRVYYVVNHKDTGRIEL